MIRTTLQTAKINVFVVEKSRIFLDSMLYRRFTEHIFQMHSNRIDLTMCYCFVLIVTTWLQEGKIFLKKSFKIDITVR